MKKKNLKKDNRRYSEKISIDHERGDKEYVISFSLTEKETEKYFNWLNSYSDSLEIDKDEDPFFLPVKFQFSPHELGVEIRAKLFDNEILLRTAWDGDEKKYEGQIMWTEELQQQTREFFKNMNGALMKHFGDSRFGFCILLKGKYVITDRESDDKWEYNTVDEFIEDGWAID